MYYIMIHDKTLPHNGCTWNTTHRNTPYTIPIIWYLQNILLTKKYSHTGTLTYTYMYVQTYIYSISIKSFWKFNLHLLCWYPLYPIHILYILDTAYECTIAAVTKKVTILRHMVPILKLKKERTWNETTEPLLFLLFYGISTVSTLLGGELCLLMD